MAHRFVAKQKKEFILADGTYPAQIVGAAETLSKSGTPQIEVDFEASTEDGPRKIKGWYNLVGYQKHEDGSYIEKDGKRLKDKANTQAALDIFNGMACDAGIEEGEEFELEDLVGLELGIVVATNEQDNKRVARSMTAEQVAELA